MRILKFLPVLLLLATPAFPRGHGHLYNLQTGEVIAVSYTRGLFTGHGKIDAKLRSGEVLSGEWSVVRGGASSWGTIYGSVYGSSGYASGSSTGYSSVVADWAQGSGILAGANRLIQCEFLVGGVHGSGACRDQEGTFYKLIF